MNSCEIYVCWITQLNQFIHFRLMVLEKYSAERQRVLISNSINDSAHIHDYVHDYDSLV